MPSVPTEFTPEINEDFYNKLARGIQDQGARNVGTARSEALSRGLSGDAFEASAVGTARNNTSNQINDLNSGMNFELAGLQRDERLRGQSRDWQVQDRDFSANESEKNRALQERLARLGYSFQSDMANTQRRWNQQDFLPNLGSYAGGAAADAGFAKLFL